MVNKNYNQWSNNKFLKNFSKLSVSRHAAFIDRTFILSDAPSTARVECNFQRVDNWLVEVKVEESPIRL